MKIKGLRWLMIGLIFLATVINYIDRQTVSVLKTSISQDLGLSNADYAAVQNSFLLLYGISQVVSGRLYDVIGTRLGFVFSIVVWSFASIAHAAARTASSFGVFRGVLQEGNDLEVAPVASELQVLLGISEHVAGPVLRRMKRSGQIVVGSEHDRGRSVFYIRSQPIESLRRKTVRRDPHP